MVAHGILSDINASNNPEELLFLALIRAKLLEELAHKGYSSGFHPEKVFLFGMLSLLDVMLDIPFLEIFNQLPLSQSFQDGYMDQKSPLGSYILLLLSLEENDFLQLTISCKSLGIPQGEVAGALMQAQQWTESIANEIV